MTLLFKVLRRFFNAGRRNHKQGRLNAIRSESFRMFGKNNVLRTVKRIFSATKSFLTLVRRKFLGEKGKDRSFGEPMNEQQWALFRDDRQFSKGRKEICSRLNLPQSPIHTELLRRKEADPYPNTLQKCRMSSDRFYACDGRQAGSPASDGSRRFFIVGNQTFKTRICSVFRKTNVKTVVGCEKNVYRLPTGNIDIPSPTIKALERACTPFSEVPTSKSLPSSVSRIPGKIRSIFGFSEAVLSHHVAQTGICLCICLTARRKRIVLIQSPSRTFTIPFLRGYLSVLTSVFRRLGHFTTFLQSSFNPSIALCAASQ